jgi:sugar/nucleoside kinase (ribokinase family)
MQKLDLVAIGHLIKENIKFPHKTIGPVLGSPATYSSVAAARLGVKAGIITKIGKDISQYLLKPLFEAGVDTAGLKVDGENTTTNLLSYDASGNKTFRYSKKAPDILFNDVPRSYLTATIFYICPINYEVSLETISHIHSLGKTMAMDLGGWGGAASTTHPKGAKDYHVLRKLIEYLHIVKASTEDCEYLFHSRGITVNEVPHLFVEWGAKIGIVTLGEGGSIVAYGKRQFRVPTFSDNVVDCTGAGDVYSAGFLAEYLRTKDVEKSALFASATSSLVIEDSGGVSAERMPTRSEVLERITTMKNRYPV